MSQTFAHLHVHTQYSLSEGAIRIKDGLEKKLSTMNLAACAITDHGNMHGAIEFYNTLQKTKTKPIIGQGINFLDDATNRKIESGKTIFSHQTNLLAIDRKGYQNLIQLSSQSYTKGKYLGKPHVDHEWLKKHHGGLLALSGSRNGALSQKILRGRVQEASEIAQWYKEIFGSRYYIEIQVSEQKGQEELNTKLLEIANALDIQAVATNDCFYMEKEDAMAQHILTLMGQQRKLSEPGAAFPETSERFLKSPEEMAEAFKELPDTLLKNTLIIAEQCQLELKCDNVYLPDFPLVNRSTPEEEIEWNAHKGLSNRLEKIKTVYRWNAEEYQEAKVQYKERLEYELTVINTMKYSGYFLIVADFVNWAKSNGVAVGPGRGSGAGSLAAFCLGIIDIDPIRYDLLFERFLNPARVSMPDFDIDFDANGREHVIEYVREKYGREKVCQISTIGSLQAKAAIRGVARVMGVAYSEADHIAKLIPNDPKINFKKALQQSAEFSELHKNGSETQQNLINIALKLEGLNSNLSTHAAGLIIMNSDVTNFMPVCTASHDHVIQSQYTMEYAEQQGAVKFDFLGLKNISVIEESLRLTASQENNEIIDISGLPLDDKKTFEMLSRGQTIGVFQLESSGMKQLIKQMQPDRIEDIIALVALFRPGPLGSGVDKDFVARKHGHQKTSYPHPLLESVLSETFGVMIYQEQAMRAVQILANFSLGKADLLRRIIGKKKTREMIEQRQLFITGCAGNNIDEAASNKIFDLIDKFGEYGFNKSHSAAYALLSYQTAWLKANKTAPFMAALMTMELNNSDNIAKLAAECRTMGVPLNPPDITCGSINFSLRGNSVEFGLGAIKNIGKLAIQEFITVRQEATQFRSLADVFIRIDFSKVNSRALEALIKSGAFDPLHQNRKQLFENIDVIVKTAKSANESKPIGNLSLFNFLPEEEQKKNKAEFILEDCPDWSQMERLDFEKESIGFYVSGHPLDLYDYDMLQISQRFHPMFNMTKLKELIEKAEHRKNQKPVNTKKIGKKIIKTCWLPFIISQYRTYLNKKGKKFILIEAEDRDGMVEIAILNEAYEKYEQEIRSGKVFLAQITLQESYTRPISIFASKLISMSGLRISQARQLTLGITQNLNPEQENALKKLFRQYPGDQLVMLMIKTGNNAQVKVQLQETVQFTSGFLTQLEILLPANNYLFSYATIDQESLF